MKRLVSIPRPALVALALAERAGGRCARWMVTFGRVPLFFYMAHILLIHVLNALLFRWESTDRVVPRRLLLGLAVLAAVVVAIALFGPELSMAKRPPGA